jgi:predicted nucleotidyltransferase
MRTLNEIKRTLSSLKTKIHDQYGVSNLEMFGSYVRGEQSEDSDIDVLVEFDRDVSLLDVSALQIYLSEKLEAKVDVVLRRSVRRELQDTIFAEAISV